MNNKTILTTTIILTTVLLIVGISTVYADIAYPNYNGKYDNNNNSVSNVVGGTMYLDTSSNNLTFDDVESRLNLGSNGKSCTVPDGKVTISNQKIRVQVDFSENQDLDKDGFGAGSHTVFGGKVYQKVGTSCNFSFQADKVVRSNFDGDITDIDIINNLYYTDEFFSGPYFKASLYGGFRTTSIDVDVTANSISLTGVS